MGGPLLYPDQLLNTYSGGDDRGLLRLIVRADPRMARLRLTLISGERLELAAMGTDPGLGVSYFAALLPRTTGLACLTPSTPPATRSPPSPHAAPAHTRVPLPRASPRHASLRPASRPGTAPPGMAPPLHASHLDRFDSYSLR